MDKIPWWGWLLIIGALVGGGVAAYLAMAAAEPVEGSGTGQSRGVSPGAGGQVVGDGAAATEEEMASDIAALLVAQAAGDAVTTADFATKYGTGSALDLEKETDGASGGKTGGAR